MASIAVLLLLAGAYTMLDAPDAPRVFVAETDFSADHTLGDPNAPLVLIEYASPTCPHCALWHAETLPRLKEKYIDTGRLLYVLRLYMRVPEDAQVAKMAACLPREQYISFVDMMFRNQPQWVYEDGVDDVHGALISQGRLAGMSAERVEQCLAPDARVDAQINAVSRTGETRYGVSFTPTFILNGARADNISSFEDFDAAFEALSDLE